MIRPSDPSDAPPPARGQHESGEYRTLGAILGWSVEAFARLGHETPRLDAELLIAHALGLSRIALYTEHSRPVDAAERERIRELLKRRSRGEPVAYLTGSKEFYSLAFRVDPSVLIPRPDTEHLVEAALELLAEWTASSSAPPRVLDLGTGSGNIAVALLEKLPALHVDAVDASAQALALALENARRHGVDERLRGFVGDLFDAVPDEGASYTLIVSNPPYVRADEIANLSPDVRDHEPRLALVDTKSAASDGLGFYREIAAQARAHLEPRGAVLVEVGEGQAAEVAELFRRSHFDSIEQRRDYSGTERVVMARPSPHVGAH